MSDTLTPVRSTADRPPAMLIGLVSALVVILVVLAATAGVVWIRADRHESAREKARNEALTAARQAIINLDAISFGTLAADLKRVEDGSTGKFKELFTKSEATLRDLYPQQ